MRLYDVAVATLAIGAPRKWTENVLAQHPLHDVVSVRQGVARRIPYQALVRLALIRELHTQLGIGVANAARFARDLLDSGQPAVLTMGQVSLAVDLAALQQAVDTRLLAALESSPMPRRGRPPRKSIASQPVTVPASRQ
jgi:hypothetical protein